MKKNGVYTATKEAVRALKADGVIVIDAKELVSEIEAGIDKRDFSKTELIDFYCKFIAYVVLSEEECYSIRRGEGRYINLAAAVESGVLFTLADNKDIDIRADESTKRRIMQRLREVQSAVIPGQYQFDPENPGMIAQAETVEDLIRRASSM